MISVISLANTIIKLAQNEKINLSPMKLQKLLYYIYKEYLKRYNTPLFSDRFETWRYGPVIRSVYDEFKQYGSNSIEEYAKDTAGNAYVIKLDDNAGFIMDVWNKYKYFGGIDLSLKTHQEGTAWDKAIKRHESTLRDEDILNEPEC